MPKATSHPRPTITWHRYVLAGLLVLLAATGLWLRLWQLSLIPVALYHDELDHVFTGEAVARYGTDITGGWSPWQVRPLRTLNYTAELAAPFHAVAQQIFGFGAGSAHIPSALFGLATIGMIGVLGWVITQRRAVAVLAAISVLISPWHIFISRMTYEASISLFFQVTLVTAVFWVIQRAPQRLWGKLFLLATIAISFFLGFFTYHGAKTTLLAISTATIGIMFFRAPTRFWRWSVIGLLALMMLGGLTHTLYLNQTGAVGGRLRNELITRPEFLETTVNDQRRLSLASPATRIMANKPVIVIQEAAKHYFSVFDIQRLFFDGYEGGFQFSLIVHGFFALSGLILIPTGVWWLWQRQRSLAILLLLFLVVSPVASTITLAYQSVFRSALTYSLLLLFAGCGLTALADWLLPRRHGWLVAGGILLLLWLETLWFGVQYLSRYPIVAADNHYFAEKLLAGYARYIDGPVQIVVDGAGYSQARAVVTYNQLMPALSQTERLQFSDPGANTFVLNNISITTDCPDISQSSETTWIVDPSKWETCGYQAYNATAAAQVSLQHPEWLQEVGLASPIDSRAYYVIPNDTVCPTPITQTFVHATRLDDFDTENMSPAVFCDTWMVRLRQHTVPDTTQD